MFTMAIADLSCPTQPNTGSNNPNPGFVGQMIASQRLGRGAMPSRLGLSKTAFARMARSYRLQTTHPSGSGVPQHDLFLTPERNDLLYLLDDHGTVVQHEVLWMASIVATGYIGPDTLWANLGLRGEEELDRLMLHNFRTLAQRNAGHVEWKEFLRCQLCEQEGIIPAAPSVRLARRGHLFGLGLERPVMP
ncbi:MAG: nitrogen fixation protein NifQ [Magnetococcales bacterium]|nr:nitrogen fixation protein NifQ [Magnetococcales bacterium]